MNRILRLGLLYLWVGVGIVLPSAAQTIHAASTRDAGDTSRTVSASAVTPQDVMPPGTRTIVDAHNCYPYNGKWADRIDRALQTGVPIGIEQDLVWYRDPVSGAAHSVLSHDLHPAGDEPALESYFFAKVKPLIEAELKHPHPEKWPIVTLNLDFKTNEVEHLRAIRGVLQQHQPWLTTAVRTSDVTARQPLHAGPILVLVGPSVAEQQVFYSELPEGSSLVAFGAVPVLAHDTGTAPEELETAPADNYHRWWNNPWTVVEEGGASKAEDWTPADESRLSRIIAHAHRQNLWIRFYTMDGETPEQAKANGWFATYNFGSEDAAAKRIAALGRLHADWIATDQYEMTKSILRTEAQTSPATQ